MSFKCLAKSADFFLCEISLWLVVLRISLVCIEGGAWAVPSCLTLGSLRITLLGKPQSKWVHYAWDKLFTITFHYFHCKVVWLSVKLYFCSYIMSVWLYVMNVHSYIFQLYNHEGFTYLSWKFILLKWQFFHVFAYAIHCKMYCTNPILLYTL